MTYSEIVKMHNKWSDLYDHFVQKYHGDYDHYKLPTNRQQKHLDYLKSQAIKWEHIKNNEGR